MTLDVSNVPKTVLLVCQILNVMSANITFSMVKYATCHAMQLVETRHAILQDNVYLNVNIVSTALNVTKTVRSDVVVVAMPRCVHHVRMGFT